MKESATTKALNFYCDLNILGKAWAYHPCEKKLKDAAIAQRDIWPHAQEAEAKNNISANYTCRMCG